MGTRWQVSADNNDVLWGSRVCIHIYYSLCTLKRGMKSHYAITSSQVSFATSAAILDVIRRRGITVTNPEIARTTRCSPGDSHCARSNRLSSHSPPYFSSSLSPSSLCSSLIERSRVVSWIQNKLRQFVKSSFHEMELCMLVCRRRLPSSPFVLCTQCLKTAHK